MKLVVAKLREFLRAEDGATAIEYALIAGCISIAILLGVTGIGTKLNSTFTSVQTGLP
jgi:pilus assembly protein Flp/PilA